MLIVTLVNGVLFRGFIAGAELSVQPKNNDASRIEQPTQSERSGGGLIRLWDSLGFPGPTLSPPAARRGSGAPERTSRQGTDPHLRPDSRRRTPPKPGWRSCSVSFSALAPSSKLLVIIPTTGTGWVDPVAARAIESMYNGDTALVAMQYLVSAELDFVPRRQAEIADGRRRDGESDSSTVVAVAADHRPIKLALYGESLGSLAGQGAFASCPMSSTWIFVGVVGRAAECQFAVEGADRAARPADSRGAAAL